ncbi:hypothetical protein [Schlesneria sp.]|uniref:hypothetical protein n=1 Tax=Schlesneria sp. TaxID=2762018 RepID=UPI003F7D23FC
MFNRHTITALTCVCLVASSPLLAAHSACCCTKPAAVNKPVAACCQTKAKTAAQAKAKVRHCCAKPGTQVHLTKLTCPCCVKSIPQPQPTKVSSFTGGDDVASLAWISAAVTPISLSLTALTSPQANSTISGPPLLALYCRWLK